MRDPRPETLAGIEAVAQTLRLAASRGTTSKISSKGGRDLVTATDVEVEDIVRELLAGSLRWPVVGEERGGEVPIDASPYWLVDPICGTRNFASGILLFSINLALVENGEVTVAVVGEPATGETTFAERGRGA